MGAVFRKFVLLFVIFPAGAVLVAFALANRHLVRLNLDPFSSEDPFLALDAPLFLFLLAALITGLLLGVEVHWRVGAGCHRQTYEIGPKLSMPQLAHHSAAWALSSRGSLTVRSCVLSASVSARSARDSRARLRASLRHLP